MSFLFTMLLLLACVVYIVMLHNIVFVINFRTQLLLVLYLTAVERLAKLGLAFLEIMQMLTRQYCTYAIG